MNIIVRIVVGAGLFVFGYYLGREVSRTELTHGQLEDSGSRRVQKTAIDQGAPD